MRRDFWNGLEVHHTFFDECKTYLGTKGYSIYKNNAMNNKSATKNQEYVLFFMLCLDVRAAAGILSQISFSYDFYEGSRYGRFSDPPLSFGRFLKLLVQVSQKLDFQARGVSFFTVGTFSDKL